MIHDMYNCTIVCRFYIRRMTVHAVQPMVPPINKTTTTCIPLTSKVCYKPSYYSVDAQIFKLTANSPPILLSSPLCYRSVFSSLVSVVLPPVPHHLRCKCLSSFGDRPPAHLHRQPDSSSRQRQPVFAFNISCYSANAPCRKTLAPVISPPFITAARPNHASLSSRSLRVLV